MRKRVAITGMGVISALGDSPASLHTALCHGDSALHTVEDGTCDGPISHRAGNIRSYKPESYLPGKYLRPLDRIGQLVVSAAKLTLDNSGWTLEKLNTHDVGLALGTMFGSAHTISKFDRHALVEGPSCASPMDFANTVINAAAGQTAIWHKLRGINSTIACGPTSGLAALGYATDLIRSGYQTAMLAGGAEEFCFESFKGFEQAGLLYDLAEEFAGPFDVRRTGSTLGEAAALLMLEEWDAAVARGAAIMGEISGYSSSYNPVHNSGFNETDTIVHTIRAAAVDAATSLVEIDCISASANGSKANDLDEALAIATTWNGLGANVPITAIKSMLGETLGAAGAVQTIDLIETMRSGVLPGIACLNDIDPASPSLDFCQQSRKLRARSGLVNSIGFDGHVSALLISNAHDVN